MFGDRPSITRVISGLAAVGLAMAAASLRADTQPRAATQPANQIQDFLAWADEPQNKNHTLAATMEVIRSGRLTTVTAMARKFAEGAYKRRITAPDAPHSVNWRRSAQNGVDYVDVPGKGTMRYQTAKLEGLL